MRRYAPWLWRAAAVALAYVVSARLGLRLALFEEAVTPLWPPTGVAVVALLWAGPRVAPGILVGAFFANLPISPSAAAAAAIASAVSGSLRTVGAGPMLRWFAVGVVGGAAVVWLA